MKLLIAFTISVMYLAAATGTGRVVRPIEIPKNAVETEPGSFHATDAQGRKWIYRKTPFGVARIPDQPAPVKVDPRREAENVKATDAGDSVRFERPGPFGIYRWETKKADLNEMERAAWTRARQN